MYDPSKQTWSHKLFAQNDPRESCCPIFLQELKSNVLTVKVLGTVFFITTTGLFLTAKHVVEEFENKFDNPLKLLLLREPNFKIGNVLAFHKYPNTDIAIGIVDLRGDGWKPKIFRISDKKTKVGTPIASFGYSKTNQIIEDNKFKINLNPNFYEGQVLEYHPNGIGITKWPVYLHSYESSPGISGGPVFKQENTTVHGICCTGFDPPPGGTFTDLSMAIDEPIPFIRDKWNTLRGISKNRPDMMYQIE